MFRFISESILPYCVILLLAGSMGLMMCKGNSNDAATSSTSTSASGNGQGKFVLLIYNNNEPGIDLSQDYQTWLKTIGPEHKAEWINLHNNGWTLSPGPGGVSVEPQDEFPGSGDVGSYFIFEAKNADEALNIAKTCPRLIYKGSIELRQIH